MPRLTWPQKLLKHFICFLEKVAVDGAIVGIVVLTVTLTWDSWLKENWKKPWVSVLVFLGLFVLYLLVQEMKRDENLPDDIKK